MGSRAIVIVCRDENATRERFGVVGLEAEVAGICYTRTGRRFFEERETEREVLDYLRRAVGESGLWDDLETSWLCLDCEFMPWSAKAQELLKQQYAAVGTAAIAANAEALTQLEVAEARGVDVGALVANARRRHDTIQRYREAYRRYCWPVQGVSGLKLAPFHLLASEGAVHVDKDHRWHMATLERICAKEGLLMVTEHRIVALENADSRAAGIEWWERLTERGGEGMVIKPLDFVTKGKRDIVQPALKCRGREYLRIIYGAEYTTPENLRRLRDRGLSRKRSLAIREFALGVEALERFSRREPLRRVHERVFGVLALESEPVDPRL